MKKRIICLAMAIIMLTALMPTAASAASTNLEAEISTAARKMLEDYAAKVYKDNAADEAFNIFLGHGFFGFGKDLPVNEDSYFVASLFNSCVFQKALTQAITTAAIHMQKFGEDVCYITGGPGWHNYGYTYSFSGYLAPDKTDASKHMGSLITTTNYTGPTNRNDQTMELLIGGLNANFRLTKTEVKGDKAAYKVELFLYDTFDFTSDYSSVEKLGYSVTKDNVLVNIGLLLNTIGLRNFSWRYETTLYVELPYACDHSTNAHRWVYDPNTVTMASITEGDFSENAAQLREYYVKTTDTTRYYFALEKPVVLSHDESWVLEFDMRPAKTLLLSPLETTSISMPYIYQSGRSYTWIRFYEYIRLPEGETAVDGKKYKYRYDYLGVDTTKAFKYSSKNLYTYRIENVLAEDGSNMPYVTIIDNTKGETVCPPTPMSTHWTQANGDKTRQLASTVSTMLSGQDFIINFIGNKSGGITHPELEIRVWENGKGISTSGTYEEGYAAPSCTEPGKKVFTCSECGHSYSENIEPALGHSYDEGLITAPTCTAGGYTTFTCHCGHSYVDNYTDLLPHSWDASSIIRRPTTAEPGEMLYNCTVCGEQKTEEIPVYSKAGFLDVADTDYFAEAVSWAAAEGVTSGMSAELFAPHQSCTRAQVVTFLWRAAGSPAPQSGECPFTDIAPESYYYDAVLWAAENGITGGVSADSFAPGKVCTRAQVVTFLWRYAGEEMVDGDELGFTDLTDGAYYCDAVKWAVGKGITSGVSEDSFAPDNNCTRAQVVTFLWRAQ